MTTEYYQIPSQQGFLPIDSGDSADPWLAAATSSLSLSDWGIAKGKQVPNPPSLFEPEDAESAVSWKHVVPLQYTNKPEVRTPIVPKQFNTTSKIDAWSVIDNKQQQKKTPKSPKAPQPIKQTKTKPSVEEKQPIEEELTAQNRYKTELCKSFIETGICRYGGKCQFAHGKEEIRPILRHPKYKTEICKTFHTTGTCPYGIRCRFIHTRSKEESIATMIKQQQQQQQEEEEEDVDDDELAAAPPGIPVPQWSKSWTMSMAGAVPSKTARHVAAPEPAF